MYYITLVAFGNPDFNQNPNKVIFPIEEHSFNTLRECRESFLNYIERNNLGSGNVPRTGVWNKKTGKCIGSFSYNGRLWENNKSDPYKEIKITD